MQKFGIERWPSCDAGLKKLFAQLRQEARDNVFREGPPIFASDIDAGVIKAAQADCSKRASRFSNPAGNPTARIFIFLFQAIAKRVALKDRKINHCFSTHDGHSLCSTC